MRFRHAALVLAALFASAACNRPQPAAEGGASLGKTMGEDGTDRSRAQEESDERPVPGRPTGPLRRRRARPASGSIPGPGGTPRAAMACT